MDQWRAEVASDLVAGKSFENTTLHVWLTLPATTALGVDDKLGYLAGYSDITTQHALELAGREDATWQRVLTEPGTGRVLDVGLRRCAITRRRPCQCAPDRDAPDQHTSATSTTRHRFPPGRPAQRICIRPAAPTTRPRRMTGGPSAEVATKRPPPF
jgi:hypothetical protein